MLLMLRKNIGTRPTYSTHLSRSFMSLRMDETGHLNFNLP